MTHDYEQHFIHTEVPRVPYMNPILVSCHGCDMRLLVDEATDEGRRAYTKFRIAHGEEVTDG